MVKSKTGLWSCSIFVDCPHCGGQQDLIDGDEGPRVDDLLIAEHGTDRTTNIETYCMDCGKEFIVPSLEW